MKIQIALFVLLWAATAAVFAQSAVPVDVKLEKADHPLVKINTEAGDIWLELFPEVAPKHVESFLTLIGKGYYSGLKWHRVVPSFVIQGGCPRGDGTGGPGYTLPAEFNARKHVKGTLAMARTSDPNSAGSQFYICLAEIPHLDNQYTVFGQTVKGHDVLEKVKQGDSMKIEIIQNAVEKK